MTIGFEKPADVDATDAPSCMVSNANSDQDVPGDGTDVTIDWSQVEHDVEGWADLDNDAIVVPRDATYYCYVQAAQRADDQTEIQLQLKQLVNGAGFCRKRKQVSYAAATYHTIALERVEGLTAGTTVMAEIQQDSGATYNLLESFKETYMFVIEVGPHAQ